MWNLAVFVKKSHFLSESRREAIFIISAPQMKFLCRFTNKKKFLKYLLLVSLSFALNRISNCSCFKEPWDCSELIFFCSQRKCKKTNHLTLHWFFGLIQKPNNFHFFLCLLIVSLSIAGMYLTLLDLQTSFKILGSKFLINNRPQNFDQRTLDQNFYTLCYLLQNVSTHKKFRWGVLWSNTFGLLLIEKFGSKFWLRSKGLKQWAVRCFNFQ